MRSQFFFFAELRIKKELVILRRSRGRGTWRYPVHSDRELPAAGNRSVCLSQGCPDPPAFDDQPSVGRPPAGKLGANAYPRPQSRCINVILGKLWHLCGEVPRVTLTVDRRTHTVIIPWASSPPFPLEIARNHKSPSLFFH